MPNNNIFIINILIVLKFKNINLINFNKCFERFVNFKNMIFLLNMHVAFFKDDEFVYDLMLIFYFFC